MIRHIQKLSLRLSTKKNHVTSSFDADNGAHGRPLQYLVLLPFMNHRFKSLCTFNYGANIYAFGSSKIAWS